MTTELSPLQEFNVALGDFTFVGEEISLMMQSHVLNVLLMMLKKKKLILVILVKMMKNLSIMIDLRFFIIASY